MLKLTLEEILDKISNGDCFEARVNDDSFSLKIEKYVPYLCAAIHDGHQFREELKSKCKLSEEERWYEEDPCTKQLVQSQPMLLAGCDSRFEYDLNRSPEEAIFDIAWGKEIWNNPLSENEKIVSQKKHQNFYKVVFALISKIEEKFGVCIVYDMHSYNWKRWDREVPVFNLGTVNIDSNRFGSNIEAWRNSLSKIKIPGIGTNAEINDTFFGHGYFLKFITSKFKNTLVLATELKKVYCDEYGGEVYTEIVNAIENELRTRIPEHAAIFYTKHNK